VNHHLLQKLLDAGKTVFFAQKCKFCEEDKKVKLNSLIVRISPSSFSDRIFLLSHDIGFVATENGFYDQEEEVQVPGENLNF
jgi:hypothetical protein